MSNHMSEERRTPEEIVEAGEKERHLRDSEMPRTKAEWQVLWAAQDAYEDAVEGVPDHLEPAAAMLANVRKPDSTPRGARGRRRLRALDRRGRKIHDAYRKRNAALYAKRRAIRSTVDLPNMTGPVSVVVAPHATGDGPAPTYIPGVFAMEQHERGAT